MMNNKFKTIKYIRKDELSSYLFSLFNNLIKTDVKDGIIYTKNNNYIVFAVDGKTLYFSYKYICNPIRFNYGMKNNYEMKNIIKEIIELLYPEYINYNIFYSIEKSELYKFISKNKLNQIFFKNENFSKLKLYYVTEDCTIKGSFSKFDYTKGTLIYYNGCNWYKIDNITNKNQVIYRYKDTIEKQTHKLDLNIIEDFKNFKWFKPHLLINKNNTNYYFQ